MSDQYLQGSELDQTTRHANGTQPSQLVLPMAYVMSPITIATAHPIHTPKNSTEWQSCLSFPLTPFPLNLWHALECAAHQSKYRKTCDTFSSNPPSKTAQTQPHACAAQNHRSLPATAPLHRRCVLLAPAPQKRRMLLGMGLQSLGTTGIGGGAISTRPSLPSNGPLADGAPAVTLLSTSCGIIISINNR